MTLSIAGQDPSRGKKGRIAKASMMPKNENINAGLFVATVILAMYSTVKTAMQMISIAFNIFLESADKSGSVSIEKLTRDRMIIACIT